MTLRGARFNAKEPEKVRPTSHQATGADRRRSTCMRNLAYRTIISGTLGSLTSTAALMMLGKAEGCSPWQPTNSTAHWMYGPIAAAVPGADVRFTGVGYATHHAATTFWALGYECWAGSRQHLTPAEAFGGALVASAIAAAVDYGATPKRFTPGWEYVLSKRSMALVYLAMAAGLAAGTLIAVHQSKDERGTPGR